MAPNPEAIAACAGTAVTTKPTPATTTGANAKICDDHACGAGVRFARGAPHPVTMVATNACYAARMFRRLLRRAASACLALSAAVLCPSAAHAELWGFVDGAGVGHVAFERVDSRYQVILGADGIAPQNAVTGKTDSTRGLLTWLEIAPEVRAQMPILREAAREHGLDVELLTAMIAVESGFKVRAQSPRGAIGLMQLTPETADRYASKAERQQPAAQRLLDARTNVQTGARMLADLARRFNGIDVALAAWNAGEGTVRRHGGKMPPIEETRAHVHMVLELYWSLLQNRQMRRATEIRLQVAANASP